MVLNCTSAGGPNNVITWTLMYINGYVATSIQDRSEWLIPHVSTDSDIGLYICNVSNPAGEEIATTTIYVQPFFFVRGSPEDVESRVNNTVSFSCHAGGWPRPKIIWEYVNYGEDSSQSLTDGLGSGMFGNGEILGSGTPDSGLLGNYFSISTDDDQDEALLSVLEISAVAYGDYGVYRCVAMSTVNMQNYTASANATLTG